MVAALKTITADNNDGRVLLALRAGPMTPGELSERGLSPAGWQIKAGYIEQGAGYYRITDAGRAACPFRNPLAATLASAPEKFTMQQNTIVSRQQVLAAIVAAGPAGMMRKALIKQLDTTDHCIDNHIMLLNRQEPPVIFKPEPGRCVAIAYKPVSNSPAAKAPKPAAVNPGEAEITQFVAAMEPEPEPVRPLAEAITIASTEVRQAPARPAKSPLYFDIDDAEEMEIGMWNTGRLSLALDHAMIEFSPEAVKKLRGFLGLFGEAA